MCIPSIPKRATLLVRAMASVARQTRPVAGISVAIDIAKRGASATRNQAMAGVGSEWIGFLDDDDELYAHHVETLLGLAEDTGAGMVWGWFDVSGGHDPLAEYRGRPFDPDDPHTVPITYLVRTDVARQAAAEMGGFLDDIESTGAWDVQDKAFFVACARIGGTANIDRPTWKWHHHGFNTSGLASNAVNAGRVRR